MNLGREGEHKRGNRVFAPLARDGLPSRLRPEPARLDHGLPACVLCPARTMGARPERHVLDAVVSGARNANVYTYPHAFGTTVDAGTFVDTPGMVGEIPVHYPTWSPTGPPLYDGTDPVVYNAALEYGADPAVMAVPCVDGAIGFVGDASMSYAPQICTAGNVCQCQSVSAGTLFL